MTLIRSAELDNGKRRSGRSRMLAAAILLVLPLVLPLVLSLGAQAPGAHVGTADGPFGDGQLAGGIETRMEARRVAMLNIIRQKAMKSDADKLLHLAQELSDDADAGGTKMSQAERMHKASEIEKLAKNVKDKMTYAVGAPDTLGGPFNAWHH